MVVIYGITMVIRKEWYQGKYAVKNSLLNVSQRDITQTLNSGVKLDREVWRIEWKGDMMRRVLCRASFTSSGNMLRPTE